MKRDIIDGKWKVVALGGAEIMNALKDTKEITDGHGHNVIPGQYIPHLWGWFRVESAGENTVILNYDHPQNPAPLRHVRDRMVKYGEIWKGSLYFGPKKMFEFELHPIIPVTTLGGPK